MFLLDPHNIAFPDPLFNDTEDGLLAVGGDLSPERILFAYQSGIFPWFNPGDEILWWSPDPRFVLYPADLKISASMRKILREGIFTFTENICFERVMRACRNTPRKDQDGTWISEELISAFLKLHTAGYAHSYEVWQEGKLVGGFYGLEIGRVFCGESMFSEVSNASKAGFINFVSKTKHRYTLIDCQVHSTHLESLGATMISKKEFIHILTQYNAS